MPGIYWFNPLIWKIEKEHEEFEKYYVEAKNLLLSYIKVDATFLKTQTDREIAIQQQEQFQQQAKAQKENIVVQEKTARAEKQRDVIAVTLSIQINKDRAAALIEEATGIKTATMLKADGERYNQSEIGKGLADAYQVQAEVVGPERLAVIKVMEQVASGKVKIVPDLLITGENGKGGHLFNTWLATMLSSEVKKQQVEKRQIEKQQIEKLEVEKLQVEKRQELENETR